MESVFAPEVKDKERLLHSQRTLLLERELTAHQSKGLRIVELA